MKKLFRCRVIGTGEDGDDFRPSLAIYPDISWSLMDDFLPGSEYVLVEVTASAEMLEVLASDPDVEEM